jgi:hypothetical protein
MGLWKLCCSVIRYLGFTIDPWYTDWDDFPVKKSDVPADKKLDIWHYKMFREIMPVIKRIHMTGILEAIVIKYGESHREVYVLYPDMHGEEYSKSLFILPEKINDNRKAKLANLENQTDVTQLYGKLEGEHIDKQKRFELLNSAIKKMITDNIV